MKGHEALIAMRKAGKTPRVVFVETERDWLEDWRDWQDHHPSHAALHIGKTESLASLDLRCIVGLVVVVSGETSQRVRAVAAACEAADASRVISMTVKAEITPSGWYRVNTVDLHDTLGVIAA